ncbi:hypothetical protein FGG08_004509 [Glutinoglossum americanum]|uniref:Uncharacterized protein n=1 Tax=Glutinoglossum americanum TaxID=1670608 RepID=A0A9P8KZG6_9PEZI|nr:hypothetical protein FGG08_004509 [Glutinoglossum americanum]
MAELVGLLGLAFGLPGLLDVCLKLGKLAIQKIDSLKNIDETHQTLFHQLRSHAVLRERTLLWVKNNHTGLSATAVDALEAGLHQLLALLSRCNELIERYMPTESGLTQFMQQVSFSVSGVSKIRRIQSPPG